MKPMLAATLDSKYPITFPVLASAKLDGVRAIIKNGVVLSRSLKPIPNLYTQTRLGVSCLEGLDGELIVGEPTGNDVMQRTTSGVMSIHGTPPVQLFVFDNWTKHDWEFKQRIRRVEATLRVLGSMMNRPPVQFVEHELINSQEELDVFESLILSQGYEGVMVRSLTGLYKFGRATAKEGTLLKVKRFHDDEATVIGVEERMHNENEATTNALGRTERSTSKDNLVPAGDLGALVCLTTDMVTFKIGTGFNAEQRLQLWSDRESLVGKKVKFKYFPTGIKEAPRFPVFLSFRSELDF